MKDKLNTKDRLFVAIITVIIAVVFANTVHAQGIYFGFKLDPKMALVGAHPEDDRYKDNALNLEISFGFRFENSRVWMGYEKFEDIKYQKWTWIAYDQTLLNSGRFDFMLGGELGSIYRKRNTVYADATLYRSNDANLSVGLNGTILFILNDWIELEANYNLFTSEKYDNFGNEMKPIRHQGMIGINITF